MSIVKNSFLHEDAKDSKKRNIINPLIVVSSYDFMRSLNKNMHFVKSVLSFDLQKRKMTEILGWDPEVVDYMEEEYVKFLSLHKTLFEFGLDIKLVPNRFIDEFWHYHILDTLKYYKDCEIIFGKMFHHYPYFGMVDEKDKEEWFSTAKMSQEIWKNVFGEPLYGDLSESHDSYELDKEFFRKLSNIFKTSKNTWAMKCSRCRTCRPSNCP